ncbi:hypothetical protein Gohar_019413, partial [Gossypium harknessii]|nr:hypothetical protein [Gossypium harknessii]
MILCMGGRGVPVLVMEIRRWMTEDWRLNLRHTIPNGLADLEIAENSSNVAERSISKFIREKSNKAKEGSIPEGDKVLSISHFCTKHFVAIEGTWVEKGVAASLINVYAPNGCSEQKKVWEEIGELKESERSNCVGLLTGSKAFNSFIDECKVVDLPLLGKKFTWFGPKNKMSRLDRFLVEEYWLVRFNDLIQQGYGRSISDHIPILLHNSLVDWGPHPFKFLNTWLDKEECTNLIKDVWGGFNGENMKLAVKLRRLNMAIKQWNGKSGGNVDMKIDEIGRKFSEWDDIDFNEQVIDYALLHCSKVAEHSQLAGLDFSNNTVLNLIASLFDSPDSVIRNKKNESISAAVVLFFDISNLQDWLSAELVFDMVQCVAGHLPNVTGGRLSSGGR